MQKALSGTFPIDEWEEGEFEFLGSKIRVGDYEVELSQEKYATTRLFQLDLPLNVKDEDLASPELVSDNPEPDRSSVMDVFYESGPILPVR